jgi:long-chain acyl-CoA synthetase
VEVKTSSPDRPGPAAPANQQHEGLDGVRTFADLLDLRVAPHGARVFLPRRHARATTPVTFAELIDGVREIAAGLRTLGVDRGDRIGLLAENRCEWLLADLGIVYGGAVDVPRGSDTSPAETVQILRHSGCRGTFVEDDRTARSVVEHKHELPALQFVVTLAESTDVPGVTTLLALQQRGRMFLASDAAALERCARAVRSEDLLTIVYTSGTTADPKGVMLTHRNVLSNIHSVSKVLHFGRDDSFLSVLPAWHMYERIMDYCALAAGGQLVYTDRRRLKEDLRALAPTVFAAVPRIWETIHDGIVGHAHKMPGLQGRMLRATLALCREVGGRRAGPFGRALHCLARITVLKKLRALTGGRLRLAVSGGGSLPKHVDELLLGIGIPLLNGYGLTETSPVAAVRRPENNGPSTIGPPLPGTEIQVRDLSGKVLGARQTGIVWIRGPQIMRGYYENPAKTAEVLGADGFFNSGDLGYLTADGNVWITGRAKDTIVLASGENVEPEPVETAIKRSPFVQQAVCVGQDQKSIGALLVPIFDVLEQSVPRSQWDVHDGILRGKAVHELMRRELDRLVCRTSGFRPCEHIAAFRVLAEPLTPENGLLTPTMKVRRHVVQERFAARLASMFAPTAT